MSKVMAAVLPWPARQERRAHVEAAQEEAEKAQRKVAETRRIQRDLKRILEDNHFAEMFAEGVTMRRPQGRQQ